MAAELPCKAEESRGIWLCGEKLVNIFRLEASKVDFPHESSDRHVPSVIDSERLSGQNNQAHIARGP